MTVERRVRFECDLCGKTEEYSQGEHPQGAHIQSPFNEVLLNAIPYNIGQPEDTYDICDPCLGTSLDTNGETLAVRTAHDTGRPIALLWMGEDMDEFRYHDRMSAPDRLVGVFDAIEKIEGGRGERRSGRFSISVQGGVIAEAENGWVRPEEVPHGLKDSVEFQQGWPSEDKV